MRDLCFVLASALLLACDGDDNPDPVLDAVALEDVFFTVTAESTGERLFVGASLRLPDYHEPILEDGDALRLATEDAGTTDLLQADANDDGEVPDDYAGSLVTAATTFTITLTNGESAVNGSATLPEPFAITTTSTANGIQITWPPSTEMPPPTTGVRIVGPCVQLFERVLQQDVGTYLVQPGELAFVGASCDVAVSVVRSRTGTLEGIGAGQGNVTLKQTRTAKLQVSQ